MNTLEILGIVFFPLFWLCLLSHKALLKAAKNAMREISLESEYWRAQYRFVKFGELKDNE